MSMFTEGKSTQTTRTRFMVAWMGSLFSLLLHATAAQKSSFVPLAKVIELYPEIRYHKMYPAEPYCYEKLLISPLPTDRQKPLRSGDSVFFQPHQGKYAECFVAEIPQGVVYGDLGLIRVHGSFIKEILPQNIMKRTIFQQFASKYETRYRNVQSIAGRVAVLTLPLGGYGHWFSDIVSRLVLLQKSGVEYDFLYAPCNAEYMKTTYKLFGVPEEKIINSQSMDCAIQADILIVPSLACNRVPTATDPVYDCWATTNFWKLWAIEEIQKAFIEAACSHTYDTAKKIFISRKDAPYRQMTNEDEIFALFEPLGFVRYELSKLSLLEQVALFYNAEYVVAAHGAGLTNLIFCRPGTKVVEIFQNLYDSVFYNIAQTCGLSYIPVQTMPYGKFYVHANTEVPVKVVQCFLKHYWKELQV